MASAQDKDKALSTVMGQIEKNFGKGAVMRLGDDVRPPIEVIPTGSIALDVALGIGGLPRGRIVEIYGPESSGRASRPTPMCGPTRAGDHRRASSAPASVPHAHLG